MGLALVVLSVFSVVPPAALTGQVRALDGGAVIGATVVVEQNGRVMRATTGPDGEFSLAEVALPATVEVRADGFASVRLLIESSPVSIRLTPSGVRESVLVTAAMAVEDWRRPATGTTVLTGRTMESLPGVTLDETLRVLAGLTLFRRSSSRASNPTTHGMTMRGLSASGASRGLVLLDGTPLHEAFGGWVTWTRLPALALDRVEVDRGAQGAMFGSDALGGVITLVSRTQAGRSVSVGATAGSDGTAAVDGAAGIRRGRGDVFFAGSWFQTDGVIPVAPESRGPVDVAAEAEWFSGFVKGGWTSSGHRFGVSALASDDTRGNGTPIQRNSMRGGSGALTYQGVAGSTQVVGRVSTGRNYYAQTFTAVPSGRATETLLFSQHVETDTTRAALEGGHAIDRLYFAGRAVISRGDAGFSEVRQTSAGPVQLPTRQLTDDSDALSAHVGWTPASSVTTGAGVRREWRAAPEGDSERDGATVAHAFASWSLRRGVIVRGSAATSHRWPTLNELVRNFQAGAVLTQANPDLRPERARSVDAALTVTRSLWSASAAVFRTVVRDAVANVTIQTSPSIVRQRRNAGESRVKGLELDAELRPVERTRVRLSAFFVDARFRESLEPVLEGNRLPQVPKASLSLSGDTMLPRGVNLAVVWRVLGAQFDDDRNVFKIASGQQLDARIAGVVRSFTWHVTLDNAFDNRVEVGRTPLVTLAPGRAVRIGLVWRR